MINKNVILTNKSGLHARPASIIVSQLKKFKSNIEISNGSKSCNAKSLTGLLTLGAHQGTKLTITADGIDENEVIKELKNLIENEID
ncbi:MAG: HPr family phosphocarrier protein [Clostridiales bacterium]